MERWILGNNIFQLGLYLNAWTNQLYLLDILNKLVYLNLTRVCFEQGVAKLRVNKVFDMRLIIREHLFVKLSAVERKYK